MSFVLFLVLNALLLLRPEELFPEVAGARLYLIAIVLCVSMSFEKLTAKLNLAALRRQPISVCVLSIWGAGVLSYFCYRFRLDEGLDFASEFGKVVLYYFLFISIIDSPTKLRALAAWLLFCVIASSTLAVLDYYEVIDFTAIEHAKQDEVDPVSGERFILFRLCSSGIFSDPNDLCLALVLGMLASVYLATSGESLLRVLWLAPIAPLLYAFTLTHSKGGMLGLLAGIAAWLFVRFGGKRATPLAVLACIGAIALVGGRQGEIGGGGTAHERLMYWANGFSDITRHFVFLVPGLGIGYIEDEFGHVAHNSFVTGYIETGLLGGGFFLGAFCIAGRLVKLSDVADSHLPMAISTKPYVFALLIAYAVGCYSLTRNFVLPTYITLGMASAYINMAYPELPEQFQISTSWFKKMAILSLIGFAVLKLMTQGMGMLGV